ncbi:MAG TPA: thrombospondin type 3 repeat-containing protein [Kiritimatiellia bacterium]|nr:thrombospondin type 3 repeat-containing protein [Kiritimatiellia bacterium]HMP33888.1 thrombospondin type 3 repeat-containing protein [Kiritimatiellia bacterium]
MTNVRSGGGARWRSLAAVLLFVPGLVLASSAVPVISQMVTVSSPVVDEFGLRLLGTDPAADYFGHEVVEGDLVQIFTATDGVAYPPSIEGMADPRNTLLLETRIGRGASVDQANPGIFSVHLSPRPPANTRLFVRIFNAPTVGESSYYADSQVFTVSWTVDSVFVAQITSTSNPLDDADDDGDSIINSMEKSIGSDPGLIDTDGDGFTDVEEMLAGTNPSDSESMFVVASVTPVPPEHVRIRWATEAGRTYAIERQDGLIGEHPVTVVRTLKGTGDEADVTLEVTGDATAFYRVKVSLSEASE